MATAAYTLSMPQTEAFDYTLKTLTEGGALIGTQIPPTRIEFALTQREKHVVVLDIPLTGHILTAKLPDGQTNATLTVGPASLYIVYVVGIAAMALLFGNLLFGSLAAVWSVLVLGVAGYALWLLFAKLPGDALNVIGERMRASDKVLGGGPAVPVEQPKPAPAPKAQSKPEQANADTAAKTVTIKADEAKVLVTPPQEQPKQLEGPHDTASRTAA
jgi:hypothetical protein